MRNAPGVMKSANSVKGFTLIELITVIVIVGITAVIGSQFLVTAVDSYQKVDQRSGLVARSRVVIEQITRQLRNAVPHSVRVSASGRCVEFLPLVSAAQYLQSVAGVSVSSLTTSPFTVGAGDAEYAIIGALSSADIYSVGVPRALAEVSGTGGSSMTFSSAHEFIRNSVQRRVFLADNPKRFCVSGSALNRYAGYVWSAAALNDANPGGETSLMAENIVTSGTVFSLSNGTEDRNTRLNITMTMVKGSAQIDLNHSVSIRNVP